MRVLIRESAYADLGGIHEWIEKDRPLSAGSVVDRILGNIERLGRFPYIGRAGTEPDTYEWVVPGLPYIVVYQVDAEHDEVVAVGVFHAARDRAR